MYAIYARQSVEKRDSISIEMQIELCRSCLPEGEQALVYEDKGFTGTNTKRPALQEMRKALRQGKIKGIIVYKLDRISRSLSDFARLSEEVEKYGVKFYSYSEKLDTTSPMGQMIVRMLIMFAEMEQKTISARIRDNYHARAEKMMPLGGVPPFGYERDWSINNGQSKIVRECYSCIIFGESLDEIARNLSRKGIASPKDCCWTGAQIARLIRNPVYVQNSKKVLKYLESTGAIIIGVCDNFAEGKGLHSIKSGKDTLISAGTHEGVIQEDIWIMAQELLGERRPGNNAGSGNTSWLQGTVICGKCGSSCYVRNNGRGRPYLYLTCRGKRLGLCQGIKAVRCETVENFVEKGLTKEIRRIINESREPQSSESPVLSQIEDKIRISLQKIEEDPDEYLHLKKTILDLMKEREQFRRSHSTLSTKYLEKPESLWKELSFSQRKALTHLLVKNIILTEENVTLILR